MNSTSRVYRSLSHVLILLAIVCAPAVGRSATTVATPVFSLAAGTYTGAQTVTITDSTSGSKIYYTTNGTTPTTSSTLYSGAITVSSSETLKAIATATGDTPSAPATAAYTILGTLKVYISKPGAQSTEVAGAATETFDALTTGIHTTSYVPATGTGIGTYGGSSQPFAIEAPVAPYLQFGGATDSTSSSPTNYFAVGGDSSSTSPVYLTLTNPVSYFGFWWSAGDKYNMVALYSGSTLYGTFSTANLLTFLNNGSGTITAISGATYNTSAYFGNPNITGTNDSTEPFAYISFVISGATINQIAFYNTSTSTSFESDNHSAIFTGNTVTIPTTFVPVESMSLGTPTVSVSVSPASANVKAGGTQQFTATVVGSTNTSVTWSISPATGAGTISSSGLYTAPAAVTSPQTVTITATSAANTSVKAPVIVNLLATPTVSAWPTASAISYGQTLASSTLTGGTASVAGTFAWTTPNTAPGVGTQSESVTFSPNASTNYSTVVGTVPVTITPPPSFTLTATPSTLSILQGAGGTSTIAVVGANGFTGSVTLAASGLPSGVTASFATNPTTGSSVLTLTASGTATVGTATVTVTGTSGSLTATKTIALTVSAPPSFTLTATPSTLSILQGAGGTSTIAVVGANGFTGSVTLAASGLPSGVTASFATNPTTGSSVLTLTASGTATVGTATVTVTGTSGSLTATKTIALTVSAPPSFTLTATPSTLSILQGAGGTSTIAVVGANGFTGSVTLAASGLPSGVTASFATNPTTGSSVLTLTASGTATVGTATVTVTGTSGSLTATKTIALTVSAPPSFTLTATPSTLSILQGAGGTSTIAVVGANGFTGSVTLAASGLPSGVTASFATNPTTGSSVLTLTASGTATVGSATVTVTGTSGSLTATKTIALTVSAPPSFTLTATPSTLSILQGAGGTSTIAVVGANGFTGSVTLAASGLPSGVTASFATNPTTGSSVLTLTASGTATVGTATVTVTGTSGSLTATKTIALTVSAPPSFTLTATPSTLSILQGAGGTSTIAVVGANGFTGSVTLAASGLPSGVTASFATNPTTGSSVLTLTASGTATVGTATVTVTGTSGSLTATKTIALTVSAPPSFTLTATPSTLSILQGAGGTSTIAVVGANGFTGSVTLAASGLPSGVTASFATNPTTGSSVLTLTASGTATVGTATVTVTGTSGSLTATKTIALTVSAPPSFTLTATPSTLSILQGAGGTSTIAVVGANGFTGSVTLAASGLPSGVTASFATNPTTGSSVLTLTASGTATVGTATVTVTGTSGSLTATTTVALTVSQVVSVTPPSATLAQGQTQQFSATVSGTSNQAVNWTISSSGTDTISATGLYTAPVSITALQTVTVTATSQANSTNGTATVTLTPIWPVGGPAGTVVTITGIGFGSAEGASSVTVGGLPAVTLSWSNTQIQAQIPTGTGTGNQNVVVSVGGQTITDVAFSVTPGLTGITPPPTGVTASVTMATPNQTAPLIFYGTAGQLVSVLFSTDFNFGGWWNSVNASILNPDGTTLTTGSIYDANFYGYLNLFLPQNGQVALPTTGLYTVLLAPQNGVVGSTDFTLSLFQNQPGTITSGIPEAVNAPIPGQEQLLTFAGYPGQFASVQLSSYNINGPWLPGTNVTIINPDGTTLVTTSMCGVTIFGCNLFQSPVPLLQQGTYTLEIAPISGVTGSVTVTLWVFQNLSGTITSGTPVPVTINIPGQAELLTFSGTAGQVASAQLSNYTFGGGYGGAIVSILNPDGSTLTSASMCGNVVGGCNLFLNQITLPQTGTYTLEIAPTNGATGSATASLWLFQNQVGTATSGTPVPVTINTPGQDAQLTFSGMAGQIARAQIINSTFSSSCGEANITILNPDGSQLTNQLTCNGGVSSGVVLPATGTYTLVIAPPNGATGSASVLLILTYPNVTMSASLVPVESQRGSPVAVNIVLTAKNGAAPTGTVSCSGAGVTSAAVTVNPNGTATAQMNGLPLGKDAIVCLYTSNNLNSFSNAVSPTMIETVVVAPATGSVSVTPSSAILYGGQTQQFRASVFNASNQTVTWVISPSGSGAITAAGLYSAPASVSAQQTVTIVAVSQAYPTQSASATITLSPPQCASSGYGFQRAIVIDHTKVPNTDQADFPFLFSTTDPVFATTANNGHVANSNGYDIIFSTDPGGLTKLDHELEEYNPQTGQVVAWVRIPTLSHTTDTVLYVFYGNSGVTTSQQNPTGVWDSYYQAVYHLANTGTGTAVDSTSNANSGTLTSVSAASGQIDGAAGFNGLSSYIQIPSADFASYPTNFSASFGVWFKTASQGVILGQDDGTEPGGNPGGYVPSLYLDTAGSLRASMFWHGSPSSQIVTSAAYNDNKWHFAVDTFTNGTEELFVDGQNAGSQQTGENAYGASYAYFLGTGDTATWPAANGSWLYFNGALDEVKVSNVARSADWIATEYINQHSPSTFYTLYPENAEEVIPATVSLSASQSQQFTVLGSTAGSCNAPSVRWSVPSGVPGILTASGLYTAPNSIDTQQTVTITGTTLGDSTQSISTTVTLMPAVTVSVTPDSVILASGQTQQFSASVTNTSNTAVTWTIYPAGAGVISSTGLYTAPTSVTTQQEMSIIATSQANPTQSASAAIILSPTTFTPTPPSSTPCGSSGYSFQHTVVIDHTKIPNTDQTNFPFLFNTADPSLATIGNGGQVTNPNGYDIIFSLDPNGVTKLDHELEEYDPVHGHVIAWVRIPTLSHTTDTVIYVFYGNPNIIASQQNPAGVWDSNYQAVYHLASTGNGAATDSTTNANNGTLTSVSPASGQIDGAASLNGSSSYMQIPEADFPSYPTASGFEGTPVSGASPFTASFGLWFQTAAAGGILGQMPDPDCSGLLGACNNYNPLPGDSNPGSNPMLYVDDNGRLEFDFGNVVSPAAYNDNNWHYAAVTYASNGTNTLYVDGQNAGSEQQQSAYAYSPNYAYFVGSAYTWLNELGNSNWLYFNGKIDEVRVSSIPRSGDWIRTEYNNQSSPSTFYTYNPAISAQVVPSAVSLYGSQSRQFATNGLCGASVTWSMPAGSGSVGTLTSSGLYTAPDGITTSQQIAITAKNLTSGATIGSSVVTLLPPPLPITLSSAAQPPYTTGSSQAFSATLKDQYGNPETGVTVTFIVNGANNNLGSATTDVNGVASYSYTGTNNGNDSIHATAVVGGQQLTSNSVAVSWIAPIPLNPEGNIALIAPPTLGQAGLIGAFTDNNGAVIEPIAIGSSSRTFVVPAGATQLQLGTNDNHYADNGGSGFMVAINGVPLAAPLPATAMPWNWVTGGLNNNYQYAMNDGTSPVIAATGLTQGQSITITYQSGTASANYPTSPSVNADGDQSWITGIVLYQGTYFPTMYTTTTSYPVGQPITFSALVTNGSGTPMPNVPVTLNISGANVQQLQATTDHTGTATFVYSGSNAGTDNLQAEAFPSGEADLVSGQANVTWAVYATPPPVGSLTFSGYANGPGNKQVYIFVAKDPSGNPVFDANVGFYVSGANILSAGGTTDINGNVPFNLVHNPGAYSSVAVDSVGRNVVITMGPSGVWTPPTTTNPPGNEITLSISAPNTVSMPNALQLNGTATDNQGNALSVNWSFSGPGTVTFTPQQQASTNLNRRLFDDR